VRPPRAGGDDLDYEARILQDLGESRGLPFQLRVGFGVDVGDGVIIVQLHAVETEFLVELEFLGEGDGWADSRAEGVGAFTDVPGAEGEAVGSCHGGNESIRIAKPQAAAVGPIATRRAFQGADPVARQIIGTLASGFWFPYTSAHLTLEE